MLFEFENLFDINEDSTYDLEEGFLMGNSFKDLYKGYKNYKPCDLTIANDKEALLLKIMMLNFGIIDLNLKLAVDPTNKIVYEKYKKYSLMLQQCLNEYEKKYQVLSMYDDTNGTYTYLSNPWPWEGYYV